MRAIQATPKTIQEIFSADKYIIPSFQRRYSWGEEESVKLFDDITSFFEDHTDDNDRYYLGNIVVFKELPDNAWVVVDGQQRLTTLLLFLRALFSRAQTATVLEACLKRRDRLTGGMINELKIESLVIEQDKAELEAIILNGKNDGKGKLSQNYRRLETELDGFMNHMDSSTVDKFILKILEGIVLLPIECDSQDDALVIFNTVNDRGMPLGDADIFKAKLFQTMTDEKEKKAMVTRWNALDNVNDLFRTWMHVKRAEEGKTEKEVAQRKFFEKRANLLGNWQVALDTLEALNNWDYEETAPAKAENIMGLLSYIPHDYCWYPISIFWYKHAQLVDGEALLPNDKIVELELLATRTVRYYFLYAVAYSSINRIKDATYRVNAAIYHDKDYLEEYKKDYNIAYEDFERNIRERRYGRSRKGLVSLLSVLNPRQDQDKLYNTPKWELEHILPKRGGYNNYNSWTEEQYAAEVESLGNLVMLEKPLNIRASAEFFQKKQKEYKKSAIQDACDLLKIKDWTYDAYRERHAEREETLLQFFRTME